MSTPENNPFLEGSARQGLLDEVDSVSKGEAAETDQLKATLGIDGSLNGSHRVPGEFDTFKLPTVEAEEEPRETSTDETTVFASDALAAAVEHNHDSH